MNKFNKIMSVVGIVLSVVAVGGITAKLINDKYSWVEKIEENVKYKSSRFVLDENDMIKDVSNFKKTDNFYNVSGCKYYLYEFKLFGEKAYASFFNAPIKEEIDFKNGGAEGNKIFLNHDFRINTIDVFNKKHSIRSIIESYEGLIEDYVFSVPFNFVLESDYGYKSEYINLLKYGYEKNSSNDLVIEDERFIGNIAKEDISDLSLTESSLEDASIIYTSSKGQIDNIEYYYTSKNKDIFSTYNSGSIETMSFESFVISNIDLNKYDVYLEVYGSGLGMRNIIDYISTSYTVSSTPGVPSTDGYVKYNPSRHSITLTSRQYIPNIVIWKR